MPSETEGMSVVGVLRALPMTHEGRDREAKSRSVQGRVFQGPKWPQIWNTERDAVIFQ